MIGIETQINYFLSIVKELRPKQLKLILWSKEFLELRVESLLSKTQHMRLYLSAREIMVIAVNVQIPLDFQTKTIKVPYRDRIIDVLLEKGTLNLVCIDLISICEFEDGVIHFKNNTGDLWIGMPISKSNLTILPSHRDKEITKHNNNLYWVCNAQSYIEHWVQANEDARKNAFFGFHRYTTVHGVSSYQEITPFWQRIEDFYLEEYLADRVKYLAKCPPFTQYTGRAAYKIEAWQHILDPYISQIDLPLEVREKVELEKESYRKKQ